MKKILCVFSAVLILGLAGCSNTAGTVSGNGNGDGENGTATISTPSIDTGNPNNPDPDPADPDNPSGNESPDTTPNDTDYTPSDNDTSVYKKYEAENADYGSLTTGTSGSATYVSMDNEGSITFTITTTKKTKAYLKIMSQGQGDEKTNNVVLNGTELGSFTSAAGTWGESYNDYITLVSGENTLQITKNWGWIFVDYIELMNPENVEKVGFSNFVTTPCNPSADSAAKKLMSEIAGNYGKKIITGQMDLTWDDSVDMDARVYADTGRHPKLMGYDFMNYLDYENGSGLQQVEEAIAWHQNGGYVQFCWHWRVTGPNGNNAFSTVSADLEGGTDFEIPYSGGSWNTSSEYYTQLINDMDAIAAQLKTLQNAGVAVLWRPLHEAAGNIGKYDDGKAWFWWGNSGTDAYIALWKLMYERFTTTHGLNNLLWVWNGQHADFYPGDDYVDFIGQDIYDEPKDYSSKYAKFVEAVNFCDNPSTAPKMVALTENGTIPSPAECYEDHSMWAWFMTWNDGSAGEGVDDENNFWTGEYYNEDSHKTEVYSSSLTIKR